MTDICKDTAPVRLSDAAGFETLKDIRKKQQDTRWLDPIIDETMTADDLLEILERGANSGDWMVRYCLGGEERRFLRAKHYVVLKGGITVRN